MGRLELLLRKYVINYPAVELEDMLKFIYQNEFGTGHMVNYGTDAIQRILDEAESAKIMPRSNYPILHIGNGLVRVNLAFFIRRFMGDKEFAARVLASMFAVTAHTHKGNFYSFVDKLDLFLNLIKADQFSGNNQYMFKDWVYNYKEVRAEIDKYIAEGYPAPSHSEDYRRLYQPCYRVVAVDFFKYVDLFEMLHALTPLGKRILLGIDGRAGAGKTTFAKIITHVYGGDFISMDDFYLPHELRTDERMAIPGGHIDFERFKSQVMEPLENGAKEIIYQKYDCRNGKFVERKAVLGNEVVVVEGSYSTHPLVRDLYHYCIFVDIMEKSQKQRLLKREGRGGYQTMMDTWVPLENKYVEAYGIDKYANILL